ncbi:hypothetical protein M2132_002454, partial [Dysgonomonas sp. PH5-45]|nr:hypothetical protein [Dysgonomonas sp. PH5-45]MDH6356091.1 hypothetical protein [Dysgonomonas sp. PH5-45]MDH6388920.1 hypothetical protein [Dysgonomonas sp. PH5-37]MDH6388985.1 hypothetical protein [Dysgonomonas sp. PH5-37]
VNSNQKIKERLYLIYNQPVTVEIKKLAHQ